MPQYETEVVNTPKPDRFKDQTSKLWSEGWDMEGMFVGQSGTMTAIFRREVKNVKPVAKKITPEPKAAPKTKKLGDGT
jgi:hypothetical protein